MFRSSKRDNELLLKLLGNLNMVLRDESVNVVKKAILTLTQLYKVTLQVIFMASPGLVFFFEFFIINDVLFCRASGFCAQRASLTYRRDAGTW